MYGYDGNKIHPMVITDYTDSYIYYHNPTFPKGKNIFMKRSDFDDKWLHPDLDKDLIIISNKQIDINALITD